MPAPTFSTTGQPDNLRISITTENELRYWTKALACTEEQLRHALTLAGPLLLDVRKYLATNS